MKKKLNRFLEAIEDYGECFFTSGSVKRDYELVTNILKTQGYWSGVRYRLYFDNDLNLIDVEERF